MRFQSQKFEFSIFSEKKRFETFSALERVLFLKHVFFKLFALERAFFGPKILESKGLDL